MATQATDSVTDGTGPGGPPHSSGGGGRTATGSRGPGRRRGVGRGTLYRGQDGMWTWVLHRITGALTFFFLFAHVLDTALVRVSPDDYNRVIAIYKTPLVNVMEVGLVGAVLFHALNGVRIVLVDFWARGVRYQRHMTVVIAAVWLVVMIPGAFFMLQHTVMDIVGGTQ